MATGKDIYQKALTRKGQAYIEGTLAPKDDPNWNGPWDCAELCSWAVYQVANLIYGCTNDHASPAHADAYSGAWKIDAESKGIIIPVQKAAGIPGAMVLRAPSAALGGHIVVSDGNGGTIEAKGKNWGVVQDTLDNRRWDYGILVPGIDYTSPEDVPVAPPDYVIYRYTNPMMVAKKIGEIQQALTGVGFGTKGIDDIFGVNTRNAVIDFQKANGLTVDGEVGKDTAAALGITLP
ncbi:peptidoglycan-binding domain-containing protein [Mucilaginibacter ginsenosidivorax]|uniref:Peptidoglycan-binding protein n=1 Tax=Mucilaginibacter ginsenosidivorax TaxID=862126 RepID=A0A5B8W3Q9_9SPHI|nr:peptidoglycan-binding domain-containing protein [Mucilaginibacter ginsenosidivorax]QEC78700.1 peptidoglycan-binding protein [Mucilaginibacter ginsenosidivorax]